jgi:hypothetical protein
LTFENKKMCKGTTTIPDFEKSESPFGTAFYRTVEWPLRNGGSLFPERRDDLSGIAGSDSKGLKMKKAVPTLKSWDEPFF